MPCRCCASWMPRRALEIRSACRRVKGQNGPICAPVSSSSFPSLIVSMPTHHTDIAIHSCYPLVGILLEQSACHELLESQHNAILAANSNGGAAVLNGLDCVFYLEVSAIGGEDGVGKIVARSYRRLRRMC